MIIAATFLVGLSTDSSCWLPLRTRMAELRWARSFTLEVYVLGIVAETVRPMAATPKNVSTASFGRRRAARTTSCHFAGCSRSNPPDSSSSGGCSFHRDSGTLFDHRGAGGGQGREARAQKCSVGKRAVTLT